MAIEVRFWRRAPLSSQEYWASSNLLASCGDGGRRSPEHPAHCAGFATATDCRTIAIYEYTALDRVAQIAERKYCRPQ
jgi:hypothetical protein